MIATIEMIIIQMLLVSGFNGSNGNPTLQQNYRTRIENGLPLISDGQTLKDSVATTSLVHSHDEQMYLTANRRIERVHMHEDEMNTAAASESFYPAFLRNARLNFMQEMDASRSPTASRTKFTTQSLLGSGDFGVLKGGTFYQESDLPFRSYLNEYYGASHKNNNGHQRPFASPLVQNPRYSVNPSDPFSNFRDFADINVPSDVGQFSELYVVYASKNNTKTKKNMMNEEIRSINDQLDIASNEFGPNPLARKISKAKLKLIETKKSNVQRMIPVTGPSKTQMSSDSDFMLALS